MLQCLTDNLNDMSDYEEMMTNARRLLKDRSYFVFPVAAAEEHKRTDGFKEYFGRIIPDKKRMREIQEESLRKSTALYIDEIIAVTDSTLFELRASLSELEAVSSRAIHTQKLEAQMEISRFENMKSAARNAASMKIITNRQLVFS